MITIPSLQVAKISLKGRLVPHINIEIKARCPDPQRVRAILKQQNADFKGADLQIDTYFNVPQGRLKLRRGNIENSLIFYNRPDRAGPKEAQVILSPVRPDSQLKEVLTRALGVLATVEKEREIYFIGNVKFHIDALPGLGSFVEIEAIDTAGDISRAELLKQCKDYMDLLGIDKKDLVRCSYSDMVPACGADSENDSR